MSIVAISIKEFGGKIEKPVIGKVNIEYIPKIENVKETKMVTNFGDKRETTPALEIDYVFPILYKNEKEILASLEMKGSILYDLKDEKEGKELLKAWKEKNNLKGKEIEILNAILRKGIPKFIYLTETLNLPPILKIPAFNKK